MKDLRYGEMPVTVYGSNAELGAAAGEDMARILRTAVAAHGAAAIIVATGNSQLTFLAALRTAPGIPWGRVSVFHMDEYLGMRPDHPASFRRFLHEKLIDVVHPAAFYGMAGDAPDVTAEMARYAALLAEHRPVACALGIGENGHLAFNDPPADFSTPKLIHVVRLAETARRQQVGEGHFATLADVPTEAISLTIPALLAPPHVLAIVPEARKAAAVKAALEGPLSADCPASILATRGHVKLYLDPDSAALLSALR